MVVVAPKDYVATIAATLQPQAEAICWSDSTTFGFCESFTHQNMST